MSEPRIQEFWPTTENKKGTFEVMDVWTGREEYTKRVIARGKSPNVYTYECILIGKKVIDEH